ncbi:MAG: hypothetical protein ABEJ89_05265 [Haloarculaceae archaeon]
MAKFTLLEVHFEGSEFTANAPFSESGEEDTPTEPGSGGLPVAPLAVLAVLAALALVLRKVLGSDDETLADVTDTAAE